MHENLELCEEPQNQDEPKDNKGCGAFFLTIVALIIIMTIIAVTFNTLSRSLELPSNVDVSKIAQLSEEQVEHIEEVLAQIYDSNLRWLRWLSTNHSGWVREYRGYVSYRDVPERLWISARVYAQDRRAISLMQSNMQSVQRLGHLYTYFANDNNTEAILRHIYIERTGSYFAAHNRRRIESYVRIGNVVIEFRESRLPFDVGKTFTDEFITLLVEMLQEEQ
ncbi:MAG: hypothetical protein FWE92_01500 [Defluviitaleaceae bacterium]|nr:hypothetical protein [Defluviitaleaceae bacterium]